MANIKRSEGKPISSSLVLRNYIRKGWSVQIYEGNLLKPKSDYTITVLSPKRRMSHATAQTLRNNPGNFAGSDEQRDYESLASALGNMPYSETKKIVGDLRRTR